jgi:ribosomal protein L40E
MFEDDAPKQLAERTGKHFCIRCLAEVPAEDYLRTDHVCDDCAAENPYPLQSTPGERSKRP